MYSVNTTGTTDYEIWYDDMIHLFHHFFITRWSVYITVSVHSPRRAIGENLLVMMNYEPKSDPMSGNWLFEDIMITSYYLETWNIIFFIPRFSHWTAIKPAETEVINEQHPELLELLMQTQQLRDSPDCFVELLMDCLCWNLSCLPARMPCFSRWWLQA